MSEFDKLHATIREAKTVGVIDEALDYARHASFSESERAALQTAADDAYKRLAK